MSYLQRMLGQGAVEVPTFLLCFAVTRWLLWRLWRLKIWGLRAFGVCVVLMSSLIAGADLLLPRASPALHSALIQGIMLGCGMALFYTFNVRPKGPPEGGRDTEASAGEGVWPPPPSIPRPPGTA